MSALAWGNLVSDAKEAMIEQWLVAVDLDQSMASSVDVSVVMNTLSDCIHMFPASQTIKSRCFQLVQEILFHRGSDMSILNYIDVWTLEAKEVLQHYKKHGATVIAHSLQFASSLPPEIISLEFQDIVETIIAIVTQYTTAKLIQAFGLIVINAIIRANLEQSVSLIENEVQPNKSNDTIRLKTIGSLVNSLCDIICYRIDPVAICDQQSYNVAIVTSTLELLSMLTSIEHVRKVMHRSSAILLNAVLHALKHPYLNKIDVVLEAVITVIETICSTHDTELLALASLDSAHACGLMVLCSTAF